MMETITLYRPVGSDELALIEAANWRAFPPRLPEQPIFYPVTNEAYARQIARDWNAQQNSDRKGFVTQFKVLADFLAAYDRKVVGGRDHEEYWIPAEDLELFNQALEGPIEVIARYVGGERFGLDGDEYEYVLDLAGHAAFGAWANSTTVRDLSRKFLDGDLSNADRTWLVKELLHLAANDPDHEWEAPSLTGKPTSFATAALRKVIEQATSETVESN